ncbi:MAG: hypothetical protein ACREKI_02780 [Gemmatimonadota bacterium]
MSLDGWLRNGWLTRHQPSPTEIQALVAAAAEDPANAESDISAGWRFAIAYNVALRLCSVALHAAVTGHLANESTTARSLRCLC